MRRYHLAIPCHGILARYDARFGEPHVLQAVREYLSEGGALQWTAQVNLKEGFDMFSAIDEAVDAAKAEGNCLGAPD